jgi:IS30 family transposase
LSKVKVLTQCLSEVIDIDERPSIVDARTRIGDWEVDLVIGKGHKGGFATLAERKSRLYLALREELP